jgi:hypothetical protein
MALLHPILLGASGSADADFTLERSLRFNSGDSPHLTRTPSSAGNRRTFTLSVWIKRTVFETDQAIFDAQVSSGNQATIRFSDEGSNDDEFNIFYYDGSSFVFQVVAIDEFRDPTAWYHFVIAFDTTQSTDSDRVKIYKNGTQITRIAGNATYPSQNYQTPFNNTNLHTIGRNGTASNFLDGYMAEMNFIDGQQLTPSSFAETDPVTGQYNPIKYTGSYGTNGFRLNFEDNSGTTATTLGKDSSGNGNNYTPSGFSVTAGQGNDSLEDTPLLNYPVLNPHQTRDPDRLSNGNLDIDFSDSDDNAASVATFPMISGKYYFEVLIRSDSSAAGNTILGVSPVSYMELVRASTDNAWPGKDTDSGVGLEGSGDVYVDGSSQSYATSFTTNDIIGVAVDCDNAKVAFAKNGQWKGSSTTWNSSVPFSFSKVSIDGTKPYVFAVADTSGSKDPKFTVNFGQRAFSHSIPNGYSKLNSANLPDPTITFPNLHFDAFTYTGNGGSKSITDFQFAPDFTWIKNTDISSGHKLIDTVRGAGLGLGTSTTNAEVDNSDKFTAFTSNGFTLNTDDNNFNSNGNEYVVWGWNAGGSTVTNSTGSISAQQRVNTTCGFSISSYTGNNSNGATVGHGLGIKPDMIIIKRRDSADNWMFYHNSLNSGSNPEQYYMEINSNGARVNAATMMNNTAPTSSVFSLRNDPSVNGSGATYIAYCFAEISQFSQFGRYIGNSSSDGPFIHTGFRPAYVLVKKESASSGNWSVYDKARSPNNPGRIIFPNLNNANGSSTLAVDMYANGFKLRTSSSNRNANDENHIYYAFAEIPFKYARAR